MIMIEQNYNIKIKTILIYTIIYNIDNKISFYYQYYIYIYSHICKIYRMTKYDILDDLIYYFVLLFFTIIIINIIFIIRVYIVINKKYCIRIIDTVFVLFEYIPFL